MTKYDGTKGSKLQNDITVGEEHLHVKPPSPDSVRRAQRVVAGMAVTTEEAKLLLGMLGIDERI